MKQLFDYIQKGILNVDLDHVTNNADIHNQFNEHIIHIFGILFEDMVVRKSERIDLGTGYNKHIYVTAKKQSIKYDGLDQRLIEIRKEIVNNKELWKKIYGKMLYVSPYVSHKSDYLKIGSSKNSIIYIRIPTAGMANVNHMFHIYINNDISTIIKNLYDSLPTINKT